MRKIGLIGFGAIGAAIAQFWEPAAGRGAELSAVLVRPRQVSDVAAVLGAGAYVTAEPEAFFETGCCAVIEAAGHAAVETLAESILCRGCEFHLLSVGALADDRLRERLAQAAASGGGRLVVPAGALAGFDGLRSMAVAGLRRVRYVSTKPVEAWRGTPAELAHCLDGLDAPKVVFSGSAREAARAFPRNANLAAAVALAGIGFDRTEVQLIADPSAVANTGRLSALSDGGELDVTLSGPSFPDNAKTSRITAMSALAALASEANWMTFR